jgi:hypothetical protein
MGHRAGILGYIGKSSENEDKMRNTTPLAGSPHEHEMPGDPRREMRKGEGRQGKTTYRRTTGESSMGPLFLPPKPGVIAYAGKAVASMCVQITFKIHVLP